MTVRAAREASLLAASLLAAAGVASAAESMSRVLADGGGARPRHSVKLLDANGQIVELGGGTILPPLDRMPPAQRADIVRRLQESENVLRAQGRLPLRFEKGWGGGGILQWPLRLGAGRTSPGYHFVSNFVDLNPVSRTGSTPDPATLLDYYCGTRTYDLPSGYDHAGTDFATTPFKWNKMDDQDVLVVAAAPGTILLKSDGNADRSCSLDTATPWNAVYIQHSDGTVAWYGHLKANSVTPKAVGETVKAGEYLGAVGSSGSSSRPHLHLELYEDSSYAPDKLIDPWEGPCQAKSKALTWETQPPYYDVGINEVTVGTAVPTFAGCPDTAPEISYATDYITPGTPAYFIAYLRDQRDTDRPNWRIYYPDGTLAADFTNTSAAGAPPAGQYYAASYWHLGYANFAPSGPTGRWRLEIQMKTNGVLVGPTVTRYFFVGVTPTFGAPAAIARTGLAELSAPGGRAFGAPLAVQVRDAYMIPVPNALVTFSYPASGASAVLDSPTVRTDSQGYAFNTALATGTAGTYDVVASVAGAGSVSFTLRNGHTPARKGDLGGDGRSDLFWRDTSGGLSMWPMNGNQIESTSFGIVGNEWSVVETADVNGDGKADLVWWNATLGAGYLWFMDGTTPTGFADLGVLGTGWRLLGAADFNGDGRADMLFRRISDGLLYVWLMDGPSIVLQGSPGTVGAEWEVVDFGDFNGDGRMDIVFRNTGNGDVYAWHMNGTAVQGGALLASGLSPAEWTLLGTGDFNADGRSDLLWRSTLGDTWVWLMNGASVAQAASIGNPGAAWALRSVADLNGDGRSDLVWRHGDGTTYLWTMNGVAAVDYLQIGNPGGTWQIVAP